MAVEEETIHVELERDVYSLKRSGARCHLHIGDSKEPVMSRGANNLPAPMQIHGASVGEDGQLTILGRPLGKVDPELCRIKLDGGDDAGSLETMRDAVSLWFPPGVVEHVHTMAKFDELKSSGIFCAKFSASWCGPCKMIAPAVDALSLRYPDVKFVHMDEAEIPLLYKREGIKAYPTFKFFKNGSCVATVPGADVNKVEAQVKKMGGVEREVAGAPKPDGTIKFVCRRDTFKFTKSASGVTLEYNGSQPVPVSGADIDVEKGTISTSGIGGELWKEGGYDLPALKNKFKLWFPTNVKHVKSLKEFDEIKATGVTLAKFSADWCGPCKKIAGAFNAASLAYENVSFLHVDVDELNMLASREGIQAMPTFIFYKDGVERKPLRIKGADINQALENLTKLL